MTYIFETACPLCGSAAKFKSIDFGRMKHYSCPTCVEFVIEDASEHRLKTMEQEFRDRHSAHARGSNATRTWVIRTPNKEELARDSTLTMCGEFVQDLLS